MRPIKVTLTLPLNPLLTLRMCTVPCYTSLITNDNDETSVLFRKSSLNTPYQRSLLTHFSTPHQSSLTPLLSQPILSLTPPPPPLTHPS